MSLTKVYGLGRRKPIVELRHYEEVSATPPALFCEWCTHNPGFGYDTFCLLGSRTSGYRDTAGTK